MKKIKFRSWVIFLMATCFFLGMGYFVYDFIKNAPVWAMSPINRHLSQGLVSGGAIFDGQGVILAQTVNGKRIYNADETVRKALLHTVGDGSVLIPSSFQSVYSSKLFGYNIITGFGAPHIFNKSHDIRLNLDSSVCASVYKSFGSKKGAALAYNYLTGEVICCVSCPSYDVYNRPDSSELSSQEYEGVYINRALCASYAPGSIFKIFTCAAGIDLMSDVTKRIFECDKVKIADGEKITCMSKHGKINLDNAFSKSCDIVFGDIAMELGKNKMTQKAEEFGFNKQFSIDGIRLSKSRYNVEGASLGDLAWSGIGQYTDTVNPMHMLMVMGALANKGVPVTPHIIKSISSDSGFSEDSFESDYGARMIAVETADKLKEMMRNAVKAQYGDSMFPGVRMCAKTGTAEVGEEKLPHGWMVGFSYDDKFPVAFTVVVENGDFGRKSAGPIASVMIKEIYSKYKNKTA